MILARGQLVEVPSIAGVEIGTWVIRPHMSGASLEVPGAVYYMSKAEVHDVVAALLRCVLDAPLP